ncbi:MAG: SDR family oxidoreductase [Candidatus Promineifilaceae bacterium]
MKIAVFGATGRTGTHVIDEALEAGYEVVAFARSPEKVPGNIDRLRVIKGDLSDKEAIDRAVGGADAVVSVLGPSSNKAEAAISSGMEHIIASMKKHGVQRLVMTAGAGINDPEDRPTLMSKFMNFLVRTFSRNVYEDMVQTVQIVRESDLDWTIVRAPMLTDQPKTGKVNVAWVGKGMGRQIPRADLAAFVVQQVADETYLRKAPAVSV